ncbi:MAG: RNA 2',3'-cyclic phosphodiesterase [bacterium]
MKHRIFIAVNLTEGVKKRLSDIQEKYPELPIRWTKTDNLHITLVFLGDVADENLMEVCNKVSEVASKNKTLSLKLNKVIYGPPKKVPPRMVWIEGEKSIELGKIQKELEEALSGYSQKGENKGYAPHITLGRIKTWQWKQIEPEERPEIGEELNLQFEVSSIEIMESYLKRGGPKYEVLESYPLESK